MWLDDVDSERQSFKATMFYSIGSQYFFKHAPYANLFARDYARLATFMLFNHLGGHPVVVLTRKIRFGGGVDDIEQVKRLCRSLGADEKQAETMAKQLLKRAEQIAQERNCDQVEAMRYLLEISLRGARGEAPPGFEGGPPPEPNPPR